MKVLCRQYVVIEHCTSQIPAGKNTLDRLVGLVQQFCKCLADDARLFRRVLVAVSIAVETGVDLARPPSVLVALQLNVQLAHPVFVVQPNKLDLAAGH